MRGSTWFKDWAAGFSVAGLLLPEAVAYAGIAGLSPGRGVIAAIAGCLVYALVGRCRFAVIAPTSSSAAVLAAVLAATPVETGDAGVLATAATAISGLIFLVAWGTRLGLLTGFIARPVLRGFAFGLGLTIVLRQIPAIVDVSIEVADLPSLLPALARSVGDWSAPGIVAGGSALVLLSLAKRRPELPGAFIVVLLASFLSALFDLPSRGLPVVGRVDIPLTWPKASLPDWHDLARLAEMTLPLVLILFAESWGTMRSLALRRGDAIAPDRELAALGLANLASALFQGMPVGAGFSAGQANEAAGAESRRAAVIAGSGLAALTLFAAPLIAHLPKAVLAAVVISALLHALDPAPIIRLWRIDRDKWTAIGAALGVVLFGVVDGMLLAIVFSLGALLRRLAFPQIARLGRLPGTRDYADLTRHPEAEAPEGIGVWRPSEALFFANAERILGTLSRAALADREARVVVLSLEESFDLDSTALDALMEMDDRLRSSARVLRLARARDPLRDLLRTAGAGDLAERCFYSVDDAAEAKTRESDTENQP